MTSHDDTENLASIRIAVNALVAQMRLGAPVVAVSGAVDRLVAHMHLAFATPGPAPKSSDYSEAQWHIVEQGMIWFGTLAAGINPDEGPETVPPTDH